MVMLSIMSGDTAVGWYAASYRFIDALILIPSVFMSVMYPVFSKFYVNSKDFLEFTFKKSFKFLTIIAIPIGIGVTILADKIILFIYDDRYIPSVIALQILIWASVLSFINYTPATYLSTTDKQRSLMIFTFLGAVLNTILNFSLIPMFSYKGAAIATVFTELFVGLLMVYYISKAQNLSFLFFDVIPKSLIAGVFMAIFLLIFQSYSLVPLILFAIVVYFTVFYIANGFEKEDVNLFNEVIGK
jgi:O-antigen/teichoic acid export membrane protein